MSDDDGAKPEGFRKGYDWNDALLENPEAMAAAILGGPASPPLDRDPDDPERWFALPPSQRDDGFNPIRAINARHALILTGGHAAVLRESKDDFDLLTIAAFKAWLANCLIPVGYGDKQQLIPVADYWLKHRDRRQYQGLVFAPEGAPRTRYNLWRGFACEPQPGDCSLFKQHLFENVCRESVPLYDWVWGWFAQLVQQPQIKPGTSLVLRGGQGVGKTKVGEVIGSLLGRHYVQVSEPRFVTGRFNSHLRQCILLHCDEAFWAGDRQAEGKIKDLVTGRHHLIEHKGREPIALPNLVRLFATSNAAWVVPASHDERRFAVLDVGDGRKQDGAFFAAMDRQMDAGGREALLHELLALDLSSVNLRAIPSTTALHEQKIASLQPIDSWWCDRLRAGAILRRAEGWPDTIPCADLHADFLAHAEKTGVRRRSTETALGIRLRKLVPGLYRKEASWTEPTDHFDAAGVRIVVTKRGYRYHLPDLAACRAAFEAEFGPVDWEM